jgi:hypothetical protein
VAALYWGSTMLLNAPMRARSSPGANFGMMVLGIAMAQWAMLTDPGDGDVHRLPAADGPPATTTLGVLLFAVGVLSPSSSSSPTS